MATTIRLAEDTRDKLAALKRDNESYDTAVKRLLGEYDGVVSQSEAREIANEQITERVVPEAQR